MGIEPTRDTCMPRSGFEDQEHHQAPVTSALFELSAINSQLSAVSYQPEGGTDSRLTIGH